MGEPSIDSLHDVYEEQLSAARYKAERDQLWQRANALEEWSSEIDDMYRHVFNELVDETKKARRLGRLVWRLQNRLARAHRREKQLRKGMREWRDKVIGAPVRTMSAYDLLPEEDLQALRWVREQGGLDVVKTHAELFQQLKGERDELREMCRDYKNHGAYGLMLEYRRVLNGVCKRLGLTDGTGKPEQDGVIYGELEKRLIPEGYEWPRFEDGEPVEAGDEFMERGGVRNAVHYVAVGIDWFEVYGFDGASSRYSKGERLKRPTVLAADGEPLEVGQTVYHTDTGLEYQIHSINDDGKGAFVYNNSLGQDAAGLHLCHVGNLTHQRPVLDADGVPIELGDDLYSVEGSLKFHVSNIDRANGKIATDAMFALDKWADPKMYTHRAPILAADGRPIREGDEVWKVKYGSGPYHVQEVRDGVSVCIAETHREFRPDELTHERPESWERIEEDLGDEMAKQQCGPISPELACRLAGEFVRRCRTLSERSE